MRIYLRAASFAMVSVSTGGRGRRIALQIYSDFALDQPCVL